MTEALFPEGFYAEGVKGLYQSNAPTRLSYGPTKADGYWSLILFKYFASGCETDGGFNLPKSRLSCFPFG